MGYIIPLQQARLSARGRCGLKSARLGELLAAGFPVPPGFCITMAAYHAHLSEALPEGLPTAGELESAREHIVRHPISSDLSPNILDCYRELRARPVARVAVRSSSTAEDQTGRSFAGLYESWLNIDHPDDLLRAIQSCWASYWSAEAVTYRETAGIDHAEHGMAVLVQAMVEATVSGVLFTRNPLSPDDGTAVVELVDGAGESLVAGDRRARRVAFRRADEGRGHGLSFLPRLADLAGSVEALFSAPQDIEWAAGAEQNIWILQTRPLTGAAPAAVPPGKDWIRAYDEPFSTLGCDLARERHHRWVEAMNTLYRTRFPAEFREASGWLYYRSPWRSPGRRLSLQRKLIQVAHWFGGARGDRRYESRRARFYRRLDETELLDLPSLSKAELSARFSSAVELYLDLQRWSYPAVELAKTSAALLERLCGAWLRTGDGVRYADLLSGLDNASVRRDLALHRLGRQLAALLRPAELESLDGPSLALLEHRGPESKRFWRELQRFLAEYGYVWADRYPRDPAWVLNHDAMAATLAALAGRSGRFEATVAQQRQQRRQRVEQALAAVEHGTFGRLRRWLFLRVLAAAERHFPRKEERNHDVYRGVMAIRSLAGEIGRRFVLAGSISSPSDLTSLTAAEIVEALQSEYSKPWQQLINQRRQPAPRRNATAAPAALAAPDELIGEPCSPGLGHGPACVVRGFDELRKVRPGDIVVCRNIRPAWSTVFTRAAGIVVETGSLLSHGATLAREYGVAAVMNVTNATDCIADGDPLTVDGNIGTVAVRPRKVAVTA